jgi:hypothetical protein
VQWSFDGQVNAAQIVRVATAETRFFEFVQVTAGEVCTSRKEKEKEKSPERDF